MEKRRLNPYTDEQKQFIKDNWLKLTPKERKELAVKWGRPFSGLQAKASMLNVTGNRKVGLSADAIESVRKAQEKFYKSKEKVEKIEEVKVTHINKDIKPAIIYVDSTRIEIPTRNIKINGVELEW